MYSNTPILVMPTLEASSKQLIWSLYGTPITVR